jgi:hypothetical protein
VSAGKWNATGDNYSWVEPQNAQEEKTWKGGKADKGADLFYLVRGKKQNLINNG